MKKAFLLYGATIIIASYTLTAQVAINTDSSTPQSSAMLDVKSTDKGFLPPRMTEAERDAISNPTAGLIVWCNNCGVSGELQVYNGTEWVNMIGLPASPFVCGTSSIKDIEGNTYNTVMIDSQCWMAKNLTTTKYNDGSNIPLVTDNISWSYLTTPAYCWYYNDQATYGNTFGALYNWFTVNTGNLCPSGWHVPNDVEWTALTTYLGGESVAGGKLKESGTIHWNSPNTGATNETGFTALPGGIRWIDGMFDYIGHSGVWWSTDLHIYGGIWIRSMSSSSSGVGRFDNDEYFGLSVRCLKD